ncbi:DUF6387 family protein [Pseudomonas iridis]|uniref:DUF6387 family protein n=1 Tax=Pseudomonas iridis TaxID=2710587 RepID=A0ABW8DU10_9PSED
MTIIDDIYYMDYMEWFDLNNYLAAFKFDAKEWYRQLYLRQWLIALLITRNAKHPYAGNRPDEVFARDIKAMRGAVEDADIPDIFGVDGYEKHLSEKRGVVSLTHRHLRAHAHHTPGFSLELMESISKHPLAVKTEEPPMFLTGGEPTTLDRYAILIIDRERPKTLLRDSFNKLLSEMPPLPGFKVHKKKHHRLCFANWARYGLLPYLDLLIWQLETGTDIPPKIMAFAIRTGFVYDERQLADTVIPLAERLMNGDLDELLDMIVL